MYYVYLLQCNDGSIYTGTTNNLERRFNEHQKRSGGHYTLSHKAEKILYTEHYATRSAAMKREVQIKSWRRAKKLDLVSRTNKKEKGLQHVHKQTH